VAIENFNRGFGPQTLSRCNRRGCDIAVAPAGSGSLALWEKMHLSIYQPGARLFPALNGHIKKDK
jgi:hypothetical protein